MPYRPVLVVNGKKRCSKCKKMVLKENFWKYKSNKSGLMNSCISCTKAAITPKAKEYRREYSMKRAYGISLKEYNSLVAARAGKCDICGEVCKVGPTQRLQIDHSHKTALTRGLLCMDCNTGLGKFKDSKERLASAILYLDMTEAKHTAGTDILAEELAASVRCDEMIAELCKGID